MKKILIGIIGLFLVIILGTYYYMHPKMDRLTNHVISECQKRLGKKSYDLCKCHAYRLRVILPEELFIKIADYVGKDKEMAQVLLMHSDPILAKRVVDALYEDCYDELVKMHTSSISEFKNSIIDMVIEQFFKNEKEAYATCAIKAIKEASNTVSDKQMTDLLLSKNKNIGMIFLGLIFTNKQFEKDMKECEKKK